MNPIRYPLGSIPGITTVVVCSIVAEVACHRHIPVHALNAAVRFLDDLR